MATLLFDKDGNRHYVEASEVTRLLDEGHLFDELPTAKAKPKAVKKEDKPKTKKK